MHYSAFKNGEEIYTWTRLTALMDGSCRPRPTLLKVVWYTCIYALCGAS